MREENLTIIRALNKYGRVPEMWELLQEIEKYETVLDKIKEEVLTELQNCKPKDMEISMEINYIEEKLERLLEEIE